MLMHRPVYHEISKWDSNTKQTRADLNLRCGSSLVKCDLFCQTESAVDTDNLT